MHCVYSLPSTWVKWSHGVRHVVKESSPLNSRIWKTQSTITRDYMSTSPLHTQRSVGTFTHTHTRTHAHTHAQCMHSKHFNTQPHNTRACVYPLCCGQGPRGRLLGSSGPAFRDVISQFRERWGEKQEESRRELVQQEHYPKEIPHCWSSRVFKRWRCLAVRTRYVKYK